MLLILLRHAIAVPAEEFSGPDKDRPLTAEGLQRGKVACAGLMKQLAAVDRVLTSPALRTRETADLLLQAMGSRAPRAEQTSLLLGPEYEMLAQAIWRRPGAVTVCVGHEPLLSHFASYLLCGDPHGATLQLKKAGAMALQWEGQLERAALLWLLAPRQLRALGSEPNRT